MVLQQGRLIDIGIASELRASMTAGWSRLVADRCLESEDNLVLWVRNLFKRRGDEGNRRTVARLAGELLAMSVQSIDGATTSRVTFEFLHMKNQCLLRMIDAGPVPSSGALDRARGEASSGKHAMSPLATILRGSASFDCFAEDGRRITALTIQTYDPRETRAVEAEAQVPAP
jgi:hypothetical protein